MKTLRFFTISLTFFALISQGHNVRFNRNCTGVAFSAYTRNVAGLADYRKDWENYSVEDIKTMLKVISGKFTKVATFQSGAKSNVPYRENFTYFEQSYSQVYSAEAAALLNKEEGQKLIEIFVGVWLYPNVMQTDTELDLALESAKRANEIYPGTVPAIIFSQNDIGTNFEQTTLAIDRIVASRQKAQQHNLKMGTRLNCKAVENQKTNRFLDQKAQFVTQIILYSDFVICAIAGSAYDFSLGSAIGFQNVKRDLLRIKDKIKEINRNIEVMGQTGYSTLDADERDLQNLKEYWQLVNSWATATNFTMWMFEAFDNPWKRDIRDPYADHYGWWKLTDNRDVRNVSAYVEKIAALQTGNQFRTDNEESGTEKGDNVNEVVVMETSSSSAWVYAAVAIGVIIVLAIVIQLFILYVRFKRFKKEVLTKDEIHEFLFGCTNDASALRADGEMGQPEANALNLPYDKVYEISRENLVIAWDSILGTGQFGSVFKAVLKLPRGTCIEVALKMTKPNCPKTALKNLLQEIKILIYLGEHKHLVSIKGAYTAEMQKAVVYVATEFCSLGSLQKYLRDYQHGLKRNLNSYTELNELHENVEKTNNSEDRNLDIASTMILDMIRWAYEVACGMEYLASKQVVHADLATRNVLLTSGKIAKITDFGLSRRLYEYSNYVKAQQEPLPWRWMSIESLKKLEFSSQSDTWSYGVLLWEIFSYADIPYPGLSWTLSFVSRLEKGLRLHCPPHASPEMFAIMNMCWQNGPQDRPTFSKLKEDISHILTSTKK